LGFGSRLPNYNLCGNLIKIKCGLKNRYTELEIIKAEVISTEIHTLVMH
jgi:hypothetical protein